MKTKIIEELAMIPEVILKKEIELMQLSENIEETKKEAELIKTRHAIEILNAKVDDKPKFTNETARSTEMNRLLILDSKYLEIEKVLKDQQRIYNNMKIELNFLLNKQRNLRSMCELLRE